MKQFGIIETQTLGTFPLDDEGNPIVTPPHPFPDGWQSPTLIPLVKLDPPTFNAATHRIEPTLVWYEDRVERDWQAVQLSQEEAAAAARKTWPNAAAFLAEFSMPELAAISLSTDPTVAALRFLLAPWPADVWSDDPRIVMGLAALVDSGIIDETRSAEITAK